MNRPELQRQQAIIDLLVQPDAPDLHRGSRLTVAGRPDRYQLVPYLASAFVQGKLLELQEREAIKQYGAAADPPL